MIAIVGGGISGLATAFRLTQAGIPFRLFDSSPRLGGVIRTETTDGFLLEGGPDAILAQKAEGIALCRELGLGDRLIPTNPVKRTVFVLHRGRLHPLPEGMVLAVPTRIGPFLRSRLFSWPGKLRMGLDLVRPARRASGDESIAAFLRRRFGQEAVDRLGEPLLAGIHAGDPERLSMRAAFPRFLDLEARHGSLIRGLMAGPTRGGGSAFYSLLGGLGELVAALVARLPPDAIETRAVRGLARTGDGFTLAAEGEVVHARAVVLAIPPSRAAPLLGDVAPGVAASLAEIPYASTAVVCLGYRREDVAHALDGYGLIVPRTEGLRVSACGFFSTKFAGRAPEGHVLLRGFLGGARDPRVLDLDDAGLVELMTRELRPILGLRRPPVTSRVFRWPATTPQLEVGHLERIAAAERELRAVPGLFLTGAGFRVTGIPDCIADGGRAATDVAAFLLRRAADILIG